MLQISILVSVWSRSCGEGGGVKKQKQPISAASHRQDCYYMAKNLLLKPIMQTANHIYTPAYSFLIKKKKKKKPRVP